MRCVRAPRPGRGGASAAWGKPIGGGGVLKLEACASVAPRQGTGRERVPCLPLGPGKRHLCNLKEALNGGPEAFRGDGKPVSSIFEGPPSKPGGKLCFAEGRLDTAALAPLALPKNSTASATRRSAVFASTGCMWSSWSEE